MNEPNTFIDDYLDEEELLNSLVNALLNNKKIEQIEIDYLTKFLNCCVSREEENYINPLNLQQLFDKLYNYYLTNNKCLSREMEQVFERQKLVLNKINIDDMIMQDNNIKSSDFEKITKLDKAAFISTSIILQTSIVISLILSLLALVKK